MSYTFVTDPQVVMEMIYARLHHLPPLGYRIDLRTWSFVADEEVATNMKQAWEQILSGKRINLVVREMNEHGFRTPVRGRTGGKPLHRSTLYDILRDPFYAGYIRAGEKLCKGLHKPLVTQEEFLKTQFLLEERRKH